MIVYVLKGYEENSIVDTKTTTNLIKVGEIMKDFESKYSRVEISELNLEVDNE